MILPLILAITFLSGTGITFRKPLPAEADLALTSTTIQNIVSAGGTSTVTISDGVFTQNASATWNPGYLINATTSGTGYNRESTITFSSANSSIATVDSRGNVTRITDGTAGINAFYVGIGRQILCNMTQVSGSAVNIFQSFASGSLGAHTTSQISTLQAGGSNLFLFSTRNDANQTYVYNSNCWAASIDFTSVSVWNSYGWGGESGTVRAATMISPRHFICANHFLLPVGTIIRFVKTTGVVVTGTVAAYQQIGSTDICVGALTADIDSGISFAKVFPANVSNYVKTIQMPIVYFNQFRQISAATTGFTGGSSVTIYGYFNQSFFVNTIVGDSGCPIFTIVNGSPVLMSTFYSYAGGDSIAANISAINTAMTALGGGYQLTTVNLSGFTSY